MDHIRKALEKSQTQAPASSSSSSVRDWMQPVEERPGQIPAPGFPGQNPDEGSYTKLDPELLKRNKIIAAEKSSTPLIDRYRLLRTRILQIIKPRQWNAIGITSPSPEAGKTLTSVNLAVTMAKAEDQLVFLIDADLRRPSVADALGLKVENGLVDFLRGNASLEDIRVTPKEFANLSILPGRPSRSLEHPSELLSSSRFSALIQQLRGSSKSVLIIVDTPPLHLGDDVLAIVPSLDCSLLVLEEGKSTTDDVHESARLLADYNLIGTVLNKSSEKPKKFESYYQSYGDEHS